MAEFDVQKLLLMDGGSAVLACSGTTGGGHVVASYFESFALSQPGAYPTEKDLMIKVTSKLKSEYMKDLAMGNVCPPPQWCHAESKMSLGSGVFVRLVGSKGNYRAGICYFEGAFTTGLLDEKNETFYATGSGQVYAWPFLVTIREEFFKDRLPSLQEGILATYWVLSEVIKTRAGGGVGGQPDLAVLEVPSPETVASKACRMLEADDLEALAVQYRELRSGIKQAFATRFPIAGDAEPPATLPKA